MKRSGSVGSSSPCADVAPADTRHLVAFDAQVHVLIARIPPGRVVAYKDLAEVLGTRAYRAVGRACNRSPGMPRVPCHRVVAADGRLHGFASGLEKKKELLASEGVIVTGSGDAMRVDLARYRFRFDER